MPELDLRKRVDLMYLRNLFFSFPQPMKTYTYEEALAAALA